MSKAQSAARLKMLNEPGHFYAAYSRYCDWIKVGFTSKEVRERIEGINRQYPVFAPFSLIGSIPSVWRAEQQIHQILEPLRQRQRASTGELYPAIQPVVFIVKRIFSGRSRPALTADQMKMLRAWARQRADDPLNRALALESFEFFKADQQAAA